MLLKQSICLKMNINKTDPQEMKFVYTASLKTIKVKQVQIFTVNPDFDLLHHNSHIYVFHIFDLVL